MAYDGNKLAKLGQLRELADRVKEECATKESVTALETRVNELVSTGGEPNVLTGVKVNGTALTIAEKMVDILIASGTANGTLSVNGVDVAVKGLAALAYKASVSEADLDTALKTVIDAKAAGSDVTALSNKVTALIGSDANKSARTIANEELAKQLIPENAKESLDTLAEVAAWIQNHPDDASAMNTAIANLTALVGTLPEGAASATVVGYIAEAIAAIGIGDYAKTTEVTAAINTALSGYYTKSDIDAMVATDAEVSEMLDEVFGATA